jgi:glycosyltransferase involved in cell wall biosynthesis
LDVLTDDKLRNQVQLFVIGEGDRQKWLISELERRKIHYQFYGAVFDSTRLAEILRSCHVGFNGYINTTAAFSYKAVTYFAAGLPIINSMTGDLQYLVKKHELGENYEGGDRKQLSNCLSRFMQNGTTVMAANCESFFTSHLESCTIGADMKDFLAAKLDTSRSFSGIYPDVGVDIK